MASIGDIIGAVVVSALFFGVVYLIISSNRAMQTSTAQRNEELRKQGIHVDKTGIAVKTHREAPTQDEIIQRNVHAAQKGAERLAKSGAVSVGRPATYRDPNADKPDWVKKDRR